jgi:hypothetical protein
MANWQRPSFFKKTFYHNRGWPESTRGGPMPPLAPFFFLKKKISFIYLFFNKFKLFY